MQRQSLALQKQLESNLARFDGIDPEEVKQLKAEKQRLEEERQLKAGEVDQVVEARCKVFKATCDKEVATARSEIETLTRQLTAIQIDQGVVVAASKRGLRATAGTIVGLLAAGRTQEEIPRAYPYLEPEDLDEALAYAAWRLEEREEELLVTT